jgi:UDP-N-acetylmuramoyl-tripeptide--D-alanyl-D-alanine ligase
MTRSSVVIARATGRTAPASVTTSDPGHPDLQPRSAPAARSFSRWDRERPQTPTLRDSRSAHADEQTSSFETPLVGEAGALACAAAILAVEAAFHVRLEGAQLTEAFRRVQVGEGAQRLVPLDLASGLAVIDDTYNANPASMAASIRAAAEMATSMNRRLVLVLGEMRELGSEAAPGHEEVGRVAAESGARLVIAVGGGEAHRIAEGARAAVPDVLFAPSVEDGLPSILEALSATDFVLVKSSRSVGTDRIVAELERIHGPRRGDSL